MTPERTITIKWQAVDEYYLEALGCHVVYVNNRAVTSDFETTCKDIEAGREPQPNLREDRP